MISSLVFFALLSSSPSAHQPRVKIHSQIFRVEVVRTASEWQRGLMFREKMGKREGMFFWGTRSVPQAFWMKNTLIPLDIIFLTDKLQVVNIHHRTKPLSEDPLPSERPAMHVLEILGGEAAAVGLKAGDKIEIIDFPEKP